MADTGAHQSIALPSYTCYARADCQARVTYVTVVVCTDLSDKEPCQTSRRGERDCIRESMFSNGYDDVSVSSSSLAQDGKWHEFKANSRRNVAFVCQTTITLVSMARIQKKAIFCMVNEPTLYK